MTGLPPIPPGRTAPRGAFPVHDDRPTRPAPLTAEQARRRGRARLYAAIAARRGRS